MDSRTDQVFLLNHYAPGAFPSRLHLSFAADVEHINAAIEDALKFAQNHDCVGDAEFEIRLALQEAIANAVLHGCKRDSNKRVHCLIACQDHELLIAVRDPGNGFAPEEVPCPTDEDRLLEDHGRGIEIMRRIMDEVRFERGGSEVHLIKRQNGVQGSHA